MKTHNPRDREQVVLVALVNTATQACITSLINGVVIKTGVYSCLYVTLTSGIYDQYCGDKSLPICGLKAESRDIDLLNVYILKLSIELRDQAMGLMRILRACT